MSPAAKKRRAYFIPFDTGREPVRVTEHVGPFALGGYPWCPVIKTEDLEIFEWDCQGQPSTDYVYRFCIFVRDTS